MRALCRGRLRLAVLVWTGALCLSPAVEATASSSLPEVRRQGGDLVAAGEPFRVWGSTTGWARAIRS